VEQEAELALFNAALPGLVSDLADVIETLNATPISWEGRAAMATTLTSYLIAYAVAAMIGSGFTGPPEVAADFICRRSLRHFLDDIEPHCQGEEPPHAHH